MERKILKVERRRHKEDLYEGIGSHAESEREEERKGGPTAVDRVSKGPYVRACLYPCEDPDWEREKRHPPR